MNAAQEFRNAWGGHVVSCSEHEAELRVALLGELSATPTNLPCWKCDEQKKKAEYQSAIPGLIRAALLSPKFSHTRFRSWCNVGIVYVYHRDETSPSGVRLAEGAEEPVFEAVYDELYSAGMIRSSAAPLSPTEGLRRSR